MIRTDLDALPVEEKTGLPYASKVRMKDDAWQRSSRNACLWPRCAYDGIYWSSSNTYAVQNNWKELWC
jgi:hypothetical protein